jgi:hypothetical protein
MPAPSWLLLAWSGFAATCVASLAGALVGGDEPHTWSLLPRSRSALAALLATLAAGLIAYPLIYGAVFEHLARADAQLGALLGAGHGVIALLFARPTREPRNAFRVGLMHALYGLSLAFLYVTP